VSVGVATTLLPVTLALVGPALDRFSFWPPGATTYSRAWERWGRIVVRRPIMAAVAGLLIIAVATIPAFSLKTGEPRIGSLSPVGPAAAAFRDLEHSGVPGAVDFPIEVVTHGGNSAVREAVRIAKATPGVFDVIAPQTPSFRRGQDALVTIVPTAEGAQREGRATVGRLRAALHSLPGGPADVGGSTAEDISFTDAVYGAFPLLFCVVGGVTLLILMASLRSVVLAVKAAVLNVVSLGAAYGFMVFFWQQGHGSLLVYGMTATDSIRAWIPVVVFASLFGLSMDYEVFVLSRMREEYDRTGSTKEAVAQGLARTGRLVTCAALILMVSFLSLSIDPNQIVKIMSTTLAVGIVVDSVVIRTLLVPALVVLLGRWNWWAPSFLNRAAPVEEARS
jgi:RND superfamily putative drug exporter